MDLEGIWSMFLLLYGLVFSLFGTFCAYKPVTSKGGIWDTSLTYRILVLCMGY